MMPNFVNKLNEIVEFAKRHTGYVSRNTVLDMLKDKEEEVEDAQLVEAINQIILRGVAVGPELAEEYVAKETDQDLFIPADVNITQKPLSVYHLIERLENQEIDLSPGYQRQGDIWTLEAQSRLIESLMLKIPIPAFYFDAADDGRWIVIDGLQRLCTFQNFLIGRAAADGKIVKERFQGLEYLRDFNGLTFDELPRQYVRRVKETSIIAFNVEKGTPDQVVFNIFKRINTGGMVLNDQEIRHALYQGNATRIIKALAESDVFKRATQNAIPINRMADQEYVARFIAFTELDYQKEYLGNIDDFLVKGMKKVNGYNQEQLVQLEKQFAKVMIYCIKIFGKFAFRRYNEIKHRGPVNKALFELWGICFSSLPDRDLEKIADNKDKFLDAFGLLLQNKDFISALRAGDKYAMMSRIRMAQDMIKEFIC